MAANTPTKFPAGNASRGYENITTTKDASSNGEEHVTTRQEVQNELTLASPAYGTIVNKISPVNSTRAVLEQTDVSSFRTRTDKAAVMQQFVCKTITTKNTQTTGTGVSAPTLLLQSSQIEDIDGVHEIKTDVTVDTNYDTLTDRYHEPIFQYPVTVQKDIVTKDFPLPDVVAGTDVTLKQLDCVRTLKTARSITIGDAVTLYDEVKFRFPSVLLGFNTADGFSTQARRSWFMVSTNRRDSFTKTTNAKVEISLHLTQPTPSTEIWDIIPKNLVHDGVLFNVNEQSVICDAGFLRANTHSEDTYHGFAFENFNYGASTPTATEYDQAVANKDYKLISESIKPWKYNTWRREQVSIIPE